MRKVLFIAAAILFTSKIYSQNTSNLIYLYSNEIIKPNDLKYETKLFSSYFLLDGKKMKSNSVKFYKKDENFFANIKDSNLSGASSFAERIKENKLNLFSLSTTRNTMMMGPDGMMNPIGGMISSTSYYYNIGEFGDLKKYKYKNLRLDLADNPKSIIYLNKYKSTKTAEILLYVVGGALAVTGLAGFIKKTANVPSDQVKDTSGNVLLMGLGVATVSITYFIDINKQKNIDKAVEAYNE